MKESCKFLSLKTFWKSCNEMSFHHFILSAEKCIQFEIINESWDSETPCIFYHCLQVLKLLKNPFDSFLSLLWPFQNYVSRLLTSKENILVSTSFRNRKNNDAKQYFTVQFSMKFCCGLVAKTTKSSMIKFNGVF